MERDEAQALAELPRDERNARLLEAARAGAFDFLDFGSHKGGSLRLGESLGGRAGLGVDLDDGKVLRALREGDAVYSADVADFPLDEPVFRFGICRHVLEHLPGPDTVHRVTAKIAELCEEFLYVEGPDFSTEELLAPLGLTMAHTTTRVHTCHVTAADMTELLTALGYERTVVGAKLRIDDSSNPWVHAAGSPPDRSKWNESDLPRPSVRFDPSIYRDFVMLVDVSADQRTDLEGLTRLLPRARFPVG